MSKDNELAWALHTAGRMLGNDYTITKKSVTTKTTTHEEIVIEYGHRLKSK